MILGIIGVGKMGSAIARGVLENSAGNIACFDKNSGAKNNLNGAGTEWAESAAQVVEKSDAVLLAVKPQDMRQLLGEIAGAAEKRRPLFLSIAAGMPLSFFEESLGAGAKIVRIMPNLPATVGKGASCYCPNANCSGKDEDVAKKLLGAIGKSWKVGESQMDVVTAVSGCGPAYFALLAAEMAKAGGKLGLDEKLAGELALQTLVGTGTLLEKEGISAEELVKKVASPGGTTEAALKEFGKSGFSQAVETALAAARDRGKELAKA